MDPGAGAAGALAANREVVDQLVGWRWAAMREAREQGHGWAEIGAALGVDAAQASQAYLERVQRQRLVHQAHPDLRHLLGYDPRWAELAAPNDADRADQQRQASGPRGRAVTAGPSTPPATGGGGRWPATDPTAKEADRRGEDPRSPSRSTTAAWAATRTPSWRWLAPGPGQPGPARGPRRRGLVERIGREIIRRWLQATPPELWRHQGRDHYSQQLRQLATFTPGTGEVDSPDWHDGVWVPRAAGDQGQADRP